MTARLLVCLVAAFGAAMPARAVVVTWEYTAEVLAVNPHFDSIVDVGDPVSGSFTFDTATPDTDPDPDVGRYEGATHSFSIGSYAAESVPSTILISNDEGGVYDAWEVLGQNSALDPIGGNPAAQLSFSMFGSTAMLDSVALGAPPAVDAPGLSNAYLLLGVLPPGSGVSYQYGENVTLVPEPSGLAPPIAAALALAARRRRG